MSEKRRYRFDYKKSLWRVLSNNGSPLRYWIKKCPVCGQEDDFAGGYFRECSSCKGERVQSLKGASSKAHRAVNKAIAGGLLPPLLGQVACVDCGRPAQCYDHRDYDKPLEVDPVCLKCNINRGPAKQHEAIVIKFPRRFKKTAGAA